MITKTLKQQRGALSPRIPLCQKACIINAYNKRLGAMSCGGLSPSNHVYLYIFIFFLVGCVYATQILS